MQALYIHVIGLPDEHIDLLLTLTLLVNAIISLFITLHVLCRPCTSTKSACRTSGLAYC